MPAGRLHIRAATELMVATPSHDIPGIGNQRSVELFEETSELRTGMKKLGQRF